VKRRLPKRGGGRWGDQTGHVESLQAEHWAYRRMHGTGCQPARRCTALEADVPVRAAGGRLGQKLSQFTTVRSRPSGSAEQ